MNTYLVRRSLAFSRTEQSREALGWWSAIVYNFCGTQRGLRVQSSGVNPGNCHANVKSLSKPRPHRASNHPGTGLSELRGCGVLGRSLPACNAQATAKIRNVGDGPPVTRVLECLPQRT